MAAKKLNLTWCADSKAEADMLRLGISHSVATIRFTEIDLKESQVNGARLTAIIEELVEAYKEGMIAGDTFPRPVAMKTPKGYLILWGNQRCEAIRQLIEEEYLPKGVILEIYLVEPLDKMYQEILARIGNVGHGGRSSNAERLNNAMYCINSLGMERKEAARSFLVNETTLKQHLKAEEARKDLLKNGVHEAARLGHKECFQLSQLSYDDESQKKIAQLISHHPVTRERITQVIGELKKQSNKQGRTSVIMSFEKELTAQAKARTTHKNGKPTVSRPRRALVFKHLQTLVNFFEKGNGGEAFTNVEQLQLLPEDVENFKSLTGKIKYRAELLYKSAKNETA